MPGTGGFRKRRCSAEWPHSSSCPRSEVVAGSRSNDGIFARTGSQARSAVNIVAALQVGSTAWLISPAFVQPNTKTFSVS